MFAFLFPVVLAVVVFASRPDRQQNRLLALLLVLEGVAIGSGTSFMYITDDPSSTWAFQALTDVVALSIPWVYLLFLRTIDAPLARPLRVRGVGPILTLVALVAPAAFFVWKPHFQTGVVRSSFAPYDVVAGPGFTELLYVGAAAGFVGLAIALSAFFASAAGTQKRRQAKAYVVAFGVRDVGWALTVAAFVVRIPGSGTYIPATVIALYALVLAYGILKTQLFDIDLKLKWTVRQSTVAAAFIAVFFIVSEGAQVAFQSSLGPIVGLVAAGALVFVLAPLQRLGERVSDAAMPGVGGDSQYLAFRKLEVYKGALEEMLADGTLSEKDRTVLAGLRRRLGIGEDAARAIERDVLSSR